MSFKFERSGILFIISSPSGAGKSTICRKLLACVEDLIMSISVTTRKKRPSEMDGIDYFFLNIPKFQEMVSNSELLEHAHVFGNYYGTPRLFVEEHTKSGQDVLFDIDWKGARQLAQNANCDVVTIFILPPSIAELETRLKSRAQDSLEVVKQRMNAASEEISHWKEYDYVLINHDIDEIVHLIMDIINAERLKRKRQKGLSEFVNKLLEHN